MPSGTVTTIWKRPEASATVVPSCTGSLNSSATRGSPGGKPAPFTVTLCPGTAWAVLVEIDGPGTVVDVVTGTVVDVVTAAGDRGRGRRG